jgi:hypothetical protein
MTRSIQAKFNDPGGQKFCSCFYGWILQTLIFNPAKISPCF